MLLLVFGTIFLLVLHRRTPDDGPSAYSTEDEGEASTEDEGEARYMDQMYEVYEIQRKVLLFGAKAMIAVGILSEANNLLR